MRHEEINTADLLAEASEVADAEGRRERMSIFCAVLNARARTLNDAMLLSEAANLWLLAGKVHGVTRDE